MSWDVMIINFGGERPPAIEDMTKDFSPPPFGEADDIRTQISSALPDIDWSDPAWGLLDGNEWSIEFNFQADGVVESFMLHVRGGGNPINVIAWMCKQCRWEAFDCSTGEFLDLSSPSDEGWEGFKAFRDRVIQSSTNR